MFDELYGSVQTPDDPYWLDLRIFWGVEDAKEITQYVWDTRVPQVTDPWPVMESTNIQSMIDDLMARFETRVLEIVS